MNTRKDLYFYLWLSRSGRIVKVVVKVLYSEPTKSPLLLCPPTSRPCQGHFPSQASSGFIPPLNTTGGLPKSGHLIKLLLCLFAVTEFLHWALSLLSWAYQKPHNPHAGTGTHLPSTFFELQFRAFVCWSVPLEFSRTTFLSFFLWTCVMELTLVIPPIVPTGREVKKILTS